MLSIIEQNKETMKTGITIKFNEDYRNNFKAGQTIEIPTTVLGIVYLAGPNGCGKSTILRAIRTKNDSLEKIRTSNFDGCRNPKVDYLKKDIDAGILEVIGTEQFSHIFAFDAEADNNTDVLNASTAGGFAFGGGLAALRQSRGQAVLIQLYKFMEEFKKVADQEMTSKNWRPLVIIDEIDEGLDIRMQLRWNMILTEKFCMKGATVLVVSHNPVCMLSQGLFVETFDVVTGQSTEPQKYISDLTGCSINIDYSNEKSWEQQTKFNKERKV